MLLLLRHDAIVVRLRLLQGEPGHRLGRLLLIRAILLKCDAPGFPIVHLERDFVVPSGSSTTHDTSRQLCRRSTKEEGEGVSCLRLGWRELGLGGVEFSGVLSRL